MRSVPLLCFLALLVLACPVCGTTEEKIGEAVQTSIQNTLDTDPQYVMCRLKVTRVEVVCQNDDLYHGIATITFRGVARRVPLLVTYDGENVALRTDARGFSFVFE